MNNQFSIDLGNAIYIEDIERVPHAYVEKVMRPVIERDYFGGIVPKLPMTNTEAEEFSKTGKLPESYVVNTYYGYGYQDSDDELYRSSLMRFLEENVVYAFYLSRDTSRFHYKRVYELVDILSECKENGYGLIFLEKKDEYGNRMFALATDNYEIIVELRKLPPNRLSLLSKGISFEHAYVKLFPANIDWE